MCFLGLWDGRSVSTTEFSAKELYFAYTKGKLSTVFAVYSTAFGRKNGKNP